MTNQNGNGDVSGASGVVSLSDAGWVDVADDIKGFHGDSRSTISAFAVLEEVKIAKIGADGKYMEDARLIDVADTIGGGFENGATTRTLPQTAVAVSLVTGRRGPTGKGRFYIPMPLVGVISTTLLMDPAQAQGIGAAAQDLVNNINNAPGVDFTTIKVCVSSSKGYNTEVTGVRVGRVVDTIRSRRAQLDETYGAVLPVA
jgi:hypothetical protein